MAEGYDHTDRTEQPTQPRREDLRGRGHVARSMDLTAAVVMLGALAGLHFLGGGLMRALTQVLPQYLGGPAWLSIGPGDVTRELWRTVSGFAGSLLPVMGGIVAVAVGINLLQVGFLFTTQPLRPDFHRLSPLAGLRRIFSMRGLVRLAASLLKLAVVAGVAAWAIAAEADKISQLSTFSVEQVALYGAHVLWSVGAKVAIALLFLAVLDYGFERLQYEQDIRMTRQEQRDELREMEGDPQVRLHRRQIQRQSTLTRMAQKVPAANVVITNRAEVAVAIRYAADAMAAPVVIAKGTGLLAEQICKKAKEHQIPVVENKSLAQALYKAVEVGRQVPPPLYPSVAELLADWHKLGKLRGVAES